jgi:hypothetical protein
MEQICLKCAHPLSHPLTSPDWGCGNCGAIQSKIIAHLAGIEEKLRKLKDPEKQRALIGQLEVIYKDTKQKQLAKIKELTNLPENISNLFDELIARRKLATPANEIPRTSKAPEAFAQPKSERTSSDKKVLNAFLLCFLFGAFGLHRFYVGKNKTAIVQLFITGGAGIFLIIASLLMSKTLAAVIVVIYLVLLIPALIWIFIDLITILLGRFTDRDGNIIS